MNNDEGTKKEQDRCKKFITSRLSENMLLSNKSNFLHKKMKVLLKMPFLSAICIVKSSYFDTYYTLLNKPYFALNLGLETATISQRFN